MASADGIAPGIPGASPAAIRSLEKACDRFEAAWRAGDNPQIDDYLGVSAEIRTALLRELIGIEVAYRRERGEQPEASEYERRFPHDPVPIRAILGMPALGPGARVSATSQVGEFEIQEEVGRGGMGIVYKARQGGLNRTVALKMILAADHRGRDTADRLRVEAEAIARLKHPQIIQIHGLGDHEGHPYLAMEYVEGGSLADRLDGVSRPPREAALLVASLARAIDHAHRSGVIHRDLKPSNILLDREGLPKVTDFGLAKCLDADHDLTRTDSVLGSPGYMAPEQADARAEKIGPAADIYSLGAILYELLTGRPPFREATVLATLDLVRTREPVPPSRIVPGLPRDIETICLVCLQKEPWRRYPDAATLAEDLRRFAAGEPIKARAVNPAERAWMWARRRPATASLAVLSTATTGLLLVLLGWIAVSTPGAASPGSSAIGLPRIAPAFRWDAKTPPASPLSSRPSSPQPSTAAQGAAIIAEPTSADPASIPIPAATPASPRPPIVLAGHSDQVWDAAFSPDGRSVATASWDGSVRLWWRDDGAQQMTFAARSGRLSSVAFDPDGVLLAAGGADGSVLVWNLRSGRLVHTLTGHVDKVRCVEFSPDGRLVASGSWDGTVRVWNAASGRPYRVIETGANYITRLAFSPDGRRIAVGGTSRLAEVWDLPDSRRMTTFRGHAAHVLSVSFSQDGRLIASTSGDPDGRTGGNHIWEVATGREVLQFGDPAIVLERVAFSPDGTLLATAGWDGLVRLWDARDGRELHSLAGHSDRVWGVAWDRAGHSLVSASADRSARVWEPPGVPLNGSRNP